MSIEYYGVPPDARNTINALLGFVVTGSEQDWEIEFADQARIGEMLTVYANVDLDLESRSALALLLVYAMWKADDEELLEEASVREFDRLLSSDPMVRDRMRFHFFEALRGERPPFLILITQAR